MITISKQLAVAFEKDALARWKAEISGQIAQDFPEAAKRFPDEALDNWVRDTMETLRRQGATTRSDMAFFAITLFRVAEAGQDQRAAGDLAAIMVRGDTFSAKMSMLRKAFASP
ncbi:MAG: hypothetical protein ABI832_19015 [bacterium]